MSQYGGYILLMADTTKTNWDAALTLGTCILVVAATISPVISKLYQRYRIDGRRLWNVLLGTMLTSILFVGTLFAIIILGYWSAQILHHFSVEQGVIRPWTPKGLVPYGGI